MIQNNMEINNKIKINQDIIQKDNVLMDNLLISVEGFRENLTDLFL